MVTLIGDVETDNLRGKYTKLHCIQLGDADGTDAVLYGDNEFCDAPLRDGIERLLAADRYVFHNGIRFDYWALKDLCGTELPRERLVDTLVLARLSDPEQKSHSLAEWGKRLGCYKGDFDGPYDVFTKTFADYARQDIVVGRSLYHAVKHVLDWGESAQLEHDVAWAIDAQVQNGFGFDEDAAKELDAQLRGEKALVEADIQRVFPPRRMEHTFTPKASNKVYGYTKGVPFTKRWVEVFNPGSNQMVAARLQELGWKPTQYGKDGVPSLGEEILSTLPYPQVTPLIRHARLTKMLGMLSDGKVAWLKLVKDGRIYGSVNPNGACTGRMSHSWPNVAQADKDSRMRSLWIPREGWKLVGVDADGLEARMLAHYLTRYDGGSFRDALLHGDKAKATDVHSRNRDAIRRCGYNVDRDGAKTFLYAMMYGAWFPKLGQTIVDNLRAQNLPVPKVRLETIGRNGADALARSMKGIDDLTKDVKDAAKSRGYLIGLDGRHLNVRSQHSALNTLLQGAGAIVMKRALVIFMAQHGHNHDAGLFGLCANVHDEVQMECAPAHAEIFGVAFADCIALAGEHFKLRCPTLGGKPQIGTNWSETH